MARYKILEVGNSALRDRAQKVPRINKNIIKLLDNMAETLYDAKGLGLAAPQVGVSKRVIVIDIGEGLLELINPEILSYSGEETGTEGCLSFPGIFGEVTRAAAVEAKYTDRHSEEHVIQAEKLLARVLQHEMDHLNGVLFIDHAKDTWESD